MSINIEYIKKEVGFDFPANLTEETERLASIKNGSLNGKSITDLNESIEAWKKSPVQERIKAALQGVRALVCAAAIATFMYFIGFETMKTATHTHSGFEGLALVYGAFLIVCGAASFGAGLYFLKKSVSRNPLKELEAEREQLISSLPKALADQQTKVAPLIEEATKIKKALMRKNKHYVRHLNGPSIDHQMVSQMNLNNKQIALIQDLLNRHQQPVA